MPDILQQISNFKSQIASQLEDVAFELLSKNLEYAIHPILLKRTLEFIEKIPAEQLAGYQCAYGKMFLSKKLEMPFSFYVGREYSGEFHIILTQNGKTPVGAPGTATNRNSGSYKSGKPAEGINLLTGLPEHFYKLTLQKNNINTVDSEMELSSMVDSPYVAKYLASEPYNQGGEQDTDKIAVILPLAKHGSLKALLRNQNKIEFLTKLRMIYGIITGLRHIQNAINPNGKGTGRHRDVKPENMIVGKGILVQYIDFGGWDQHDCKIRTHEYCPPEYIEIEVRKGTSTRYQKKSYALSFWSAATTEQRANWSNDISGFKADVWGAGMTIYQVLFNQLPTAQSLETLNGCEYLKAMLSADPAKRCSADEALTLFLRDCQQTLTQPQLVVFLSFLSEHHKNDFQRTQFLSELLAAIGQDWFKFIAKDKKILMPYQQLLNYSKLLTVSEWLRFLNLYKIILTSSELIDFEQKLVLRPEFSEMYLCESLLHAARTQDHKVIRLIKTSTFDFSNYFVKVPMHKARDLLLAGVTPCLYAGNYGTDLISAWFSLPENMYMLLHLIIPTLNSLELKKVVKQMQDYNCMVHLQELLRYFYQNKCLSIMIITTLNEAGVPRDLLCQWLCDQLEPNPETIMFYFERKIFEWIGYPNVSILANQSVLCRMAIVALHYGNNELLSQIKFDMKTLVTLIVNADNLYYSPVYYIDQLRLSGRIDIWAQPLDMSRDRTKLTEFTGVNDVLAKQYLSMQPINIPCLKNMINAEQSCEHQSWKAAVSALLKCKQLTNEQISALCEAGVSSTELLVYFIPAFPEVIPTLNEHKISVVNYLKKNAGTTVEELIFYMEINQPINSSNSNALMQQKIHYLRSMRMPDTASATFGFLERAVSYLYHNSTLGSVDVAYTVIMAANEQELKQIALNYPNYFGVIMTTPTKQIPRRSNK